MLNMKIKSHEGKEFGAYLAKANKPKAPGIVIIQEIFGVNAGMMAIAESWAKQGYHAIVPDLFWRMQPGLDISDKTDGEWKQAVGFYQKFDKQNGLKDLITTLNYARSMEGASGKAASMGFCLGGLMAFQMAVHSDADCNASYYGGGIENELAGVPDIKKPLLMHLAGEDEHQDKATQAKILEAVKKNSNVTAYVYEGAKHAFARVNGMSANPAAAELAHTRTAEFFGKHLA